MVTIYVASTNDVILIKITDVIAEDSSNVKFNKIIYEASHYPTITSS